MQRVGEGSSIKTEFYEFRRDIVEVLGNIIERLEALEDYLSSKQR